MNRLFNERVNNRVSPLSGVGVGQQCRQTCDIANNANSVNPTAHNRPIAETAKRFSFNGIFDSKPTSEGSVASDSTASPVVSPMVALNHSRQSPTAADNDIDSRDEIRDEDSNQRVHSKRGRKRKVKEVSDPLLLKMETKKRVLKVGTTEELAQKFNIDVNYSENSDQNSNNRIITTIRSKHKNHSTDQIVDNETESKSELMQRFLSSQTATTSPAIPSDNDYNYDLNCVYSEPNVSTNDHYLHENYSSEQTTHPSVPQHLDISASNHQKTISSDSVGDEIKDILSHLPPLYVNDIVWSDSEQRDDKSSDNYIISDERDHNCSDFETNIENNDLNENIVKKSNKCLNNCNSKQINRHLTEYQTEKYCQQTWECVNGTYDSEGEFRPWSSMTSALSYNGEVLHILPYVDIEVEEHISDSE